ncbi:efflux RND transporter periplasmic adaptor subunit [Tepidanaerobacter syntrophicus]|uniref:HlyD family secretion protein n=1 Tax=Tepidanaerobacter syntrophicus TaxID=224999 RepID=A0A0U9HKL1_9FIRM|nr:HlyD family efflux transporter periplasmic adaptor subunit [Tepidanaerobacter syntrophicus]GAQ24607.1 HlyD family secretion protein [Tepidanaerobacter syntrophicus]
MSKKVIKIAIICVVVAALIFAGYLWKQKSSSKGTAAAQKLSTAKVTKGNLEVVLKDSGTLEPMEQETINLKVDGTVKKVYFNEGDVVKEGDLLYELSNEDLAISLQKAELSLKQQQIDLQDALKQKEKAVIYAPADGVVKSVDIKVGDSVNANTVVATIQNQDKCQVKVPFLSSQTSKMKIGQKAEIMFIDPIYTIDGVVTKIDTVGTRTSYGSIYYYVTITVDGNYYVEGSDTSVEGYVITDSGKEEGMEQALIEPLDAVEVKSEISSKVNNVYIEEGQIVTKGQKLFSLDLEDINANIEKQQLSLQQAQLDLQSKRSELENLLVYAPIDGTIIEQNVREGDLIRPSTSSSSSSEPAAVIVNYSKMQVVLPVDELDINNITVGMPVNITAEAVPDKVFKGQVEKIAEQGTSQNNVSTFDVTITTDKVNELKAGMTVDVEMIIANKQDVLMLPITAIQYRNNKTYVMLASAEGDTSSSADKTANSKNVNKTSNATSTANNMVEVKTGISNDEYVEIVSGLNEGDTVLLSNAASTSTTNSQRQNEMMPMSPAPTEGPAPSGRG